MSRNSIEVIQKGDDRGNNMAFRVDLPSGVKIFALGTENDYGGDWDLGPTWNYIVLADTPFMVDTGNKGMGAKLLGLMDRLGLAVKDLECILLSHGHEDHDGGLAEIARVAPVNIRAHENYDRLIRFYPTKTPPRAARGFPASCWHCPMPKAFSDTHCVQYHKTRSSLRIQTIPGADSTLDGATHVYYVPGHSPDSLAVRIGEEAILVGDTVLPDITPHPTREEFHNLTKGILPPGYEQGDRIYGLRAYIRSLKKLGRIAQAHPGMIVLPAHRLYYKSVWNWMSLDERVDELIGHHIQRCGELRRIPAERTRQPAGRTRNPQPSRVAPLERRRRPT
ncbi:MAG: MBL fold metallo-hydrolase [Deltaproteobacteria bacterium]|nr:MBL fold metallo-hydrolase [Deltaproteobacteria bacterium]